MGEADGFLGNQQKETEREGGEFGRGTMDWPSSPKGTFPDNLLMDYTVEFYGAEVEGEMFTYVWLVTLNPSPLFLKSYSQINIWIGA